MPELGREVVAVVRQCMEVLALAGELAISADVEVARCGLGFDLGRGEVVRVDSRLELYVVGVDVSVNVFEGFFGGRWVFGDGRLIASRGAVGLRGGQSGEEGEKEKYW